MTFGGQRLSVATRRWLFASAAMSAMVALLHLGIVFAGPAAYAFFGAQELADMKAAGSRIPDAITVSIVLLFATWGYYGLAAADALRRRPPFVAAGFWVIGSVYTVRGLGVVPEALGLATGVGEVPLRYAVFSGTALVIGLCHLRGGLLRHRELRVQRHPA